MSSIYNLAVGSRGKMLNKQTNGGNVEIIPARRRALNVDYHIISVLLSSVHVYSVHSALFSLQRWGYKHSETLQGFIRGFNSIAQNGRRRGGVGVHLQDGLRGGLVDPELFIKDEDLAPR